MFGEIGVHINIFNISQDQLGGPGRQEPPASSGCSEYIGESYFEYLSKLDDLVLLMDESHRYRAIGRRAGHQRTEADPRPGTHGHAAGRRPATRP